MTEKGVECYRNSAKVDDTDLHRVARDRTASYVPRAKNAAVAEDCRQGLGVTQSRSRWVFLILRKG